MKNVKETTLFTSKGESIGLTMLDFWKYQYSNIFDLQEHIAEFIVGKALGELGHVKSHLRAAVFSSVKGK